MHVLITGGAGFIGSNLAAHHLGKKDTVFALDDLSTGSLANIKPFRGDDNFRFEKADIIDWDGLDKAVAWADRIYHMAAVVGVFRVLADPIRVLQANIGGTERILQLIQLGGWKPQVVLASTSEVYGHGIRCDVRQEGSAASGQGCVMPLDFREDDELIMSSDISLRWNYSTSKLVDEAYGLSYHRKFGIPLVVVRFFNTIGPSQTGKYGMVVPRFVDQALAGGPITVYGDGSQTRCFCDVRDTVVILDRLASNRASYGQIVNVGNNRDVSMNDLARVVIERSGSPAGIKHIPYKEAYSEVFEEIFHRRPNMTRMTELSGYTPQWSLEQTLDDLIARKRESAGTAGFDSAKKE
jgi:UDP-glucose 4-epimerase